MSENHDLKEDKLNRKEEINFLINYLTKRFELKTKDPFVLNINAPWGYGKTFFLKSLKEELEKEHEVIYFDAWKNDFTKEPLLAFFSEINNSLEKYLKAYNKTKKPFLNSIFKSSLPILISVLTKHLTGLSLEQFDELLSEDEEEKKDVKDDAKTTLSSIMSKTTELALKEHSTIKKSIKEFKINMLEILELIKNQEKKLPLFILIDELDRCRPNYAIELLENIKHIFDIEGIYFIVATNSQELSHSINAIYGANFSSETYLKRFFNQEYTLKEPDIYDYCKFLFEKEIDVLLSDKVKIFNLLSPENYENKNLNAIMFSTYAQYFNLSLRDISQAIDTLSTILLTWENENEELHLAYILFFIMCKQKSNEMFEEQRNGFNLIKFTGKIKEKIVNDKYKLTITPYRKDQIIDKEIQISEIIKRYEKIKNENELYNLNISDNMEFDTLKNNYINTIWKKDFLNQYPNLIINAGQLK
ncbi:MAG: P-loop NTPase fold protein [Aliarcobacter sp.]|nr:P-loop NTPase fold protein [Aliarcobacter sp.]